MADIVERLRGIVCSPGDPVVHVLCEAADEIERLRADNAYLGKLADGDNDIELAEADTEIERLRLALQAIAEIDWETEGPVLARNALKVRKALGDQHEQADEQAGHAAEGEEVAAAEEAQG